eukprot:1179990-Prorocentrum_minimum.AAC.4
MGCGWTARSRLEWRVSAESAACRPAGPLAPTTAQQGVNRGSAGGLGTCGGVAAGGQPRPFLRKAHTASAVQPARYVLQTCNTGGAQPRRTGVQSQKSPQSAAAYSAAQSRAMSIAARCAGLSKLTFLLAALKTWLRSKASFCRQAKALSKLG